MAGFDIDAFEERIRGILRSKKGIGLDNRDNRDDILQGLLDKVKTRKTERTKTLSL